jgi:hypothetical protein
MNPADAPAPPRIVRFVGCLRRRLHVPRGTVVLGRGASPATALLAVRHHPRLGPRATRVVGVSSQSADTVRQIPPHSPETRPTPCEHPRNLGRRHAQLALFGQKLCPKLPSCVEDRRRRHREKPTGSCEHTATEALVSSRIVRLVPPVGRVNAGHRDGPARQFHRRGFDLSPGWLGTDRSALA